jgi:hypothetical protein
MARTVNKEKAAASKNGFMFSDDVESPNLCNYAVKSLCCFGFSKELTTTSNKIKYFKWKVNIFIPR